MGGVHCLLITAPFLTADNRASVKKNATSCSELQRNSLGAHTVQIELNYVSIQHWLHQWKKSKQTIKSKIVLIFCYETFMFQKMTNDDNVFPLLDERSAAITTALLSVVITSPCWEEHLEKILIKVGTKLNCQNRPITFPFFLVNGENFLLR